MGDLKGIKGIVPPKRVFFYPYISTYSKKEQSGSNEFAYNAGMDLKIGLNEAYTLDATLIPDFGQTISDQLILNLTPYEIQFQEPGVLEPLPVVLLLKAPLKKTLPHLFFQEEERT